MIITKDVLKYEIDHIEDEYMEILYNVIKAFERPFQRVSSSHPLSVTQWEDFLNEFAGCFADVPICRGDQGTYEERAPLQ